MKSKKINPKNIFYLSLDNAYLKTVSSSPIKDSLDAYSKFIIQKPLNDIKDRIYIFFDEVQYINEWSQYIKTLYDSKYNAKVFISGSSSLDIKEGSAALVGRLDHQILLPVKFIDYLCYKEKKIQKPLDKFSLNIRKLFKIAVGNKKTGILPQLFDQVYGELSPFENSIKIHLNHYLIKGGYPEFLDIDDYNLISQKIRDSWKLVMYEISTRMKVRDTKSIEELYSLLCSMSSQRMNVQKLSSTLGIQNITTKQYLNYLESAFLLSLSEYFSGDRSSRFRKEKKVFIHDVGLRNAITNSLNERLLQNPSELGEVVETVVYDHAKRLRFFLENAREHSLFYWKYQLKEVDIILPVGKIAIPIEIKYQNAISKSDVLSVKKFMERYNSPFGLIITKDLLKFEENIFYLPLWIFLIMC
jgi:predicted AAA+ superfamily ATPase